MWADRVISFGALVRFCFHPMMLGLILRNAGGRIHGLPTSGHAGMFGKHAVSPAQANFYPPGFEPCGGPTHWFTHLLLPWLTFALLFLVPDTRMIRASVAETIHEDFVRTAREKKKKKKKKTPPPPPPRHVPPNAGLRVLTMVGMEIGTAIGVCIYIESAFGIGVRSSRDVPASQQVERNPARGRQMRVRAPKPPRTFLEMDELLGRLVDALARQMVRPVSKNRHVSRVRGLRRPAQAGGPPGPRPRSGPQSVPSSAFRACCHRCQGRPARR